MPNRPFPNNPLDKYFGVSKGQGNVSNGHLSYSTSVEVGERVKYHGCSLQEGLFIRNWPQVHWMSCDSADISSTLGSMQECLTVLISMDRLLSACSYSPNSDVSHICEVQTNYMSCFYVRLLREFQLGGYRYSAICGSYRKSAFQFHTSYENFKYFLHLHVLCHKQGHMAASKGGFGLFILEIKLCLIWFNRAFQISFLSISPGFPFSSWDCLQRLCEALRANSERSTEWNTTVHLFSFRGWPLLCCKICFVLFRCLNSPKRHHWKSTKAQRNPTEVLKSYKRDKEAFLSQSFYYYILNLHLSLRIFLESFGKNDSLSHMHQLSDTFKIMCLYLFNWELPQINVFSLKDFKYLIIPRHF